MLRLLSAGSDDHCGCRVEEILVNGVDLHVHYEDGSADAYLDWGDECDPAEVSIPAPTVCFSASSSRSSASFGHALEEAMTDLMELADRLEGGSDRFLKWAYKQPYSGAPVISIPRHPDNIDALLTEAAACIREMVEWRPIETAPRDGSLIMMVCTDPSVQSFGVKKFPHVVLGNWQDPRPGRPASDGAWNVPMCDWWIGEHDGVLTHWLPLPPAPGAEDE